jgi:hypothetical protein
MLITLIAMTKMPHCRRWVEFRQEVLRQPGGSRQLLLGRPSLSSVPWVSEEVKRRLQASGLRRPGFRSSH